jgi:hypothetical protein
MGQFNKDNHAQLLSVIPGVKSYDERLNILDQWWGKISLIGKINSQNVAASILDEMQSTKDKFSALQIRLIQSLLDEHQLKRLADDKNTSQVAIDILIRNLFERTADVGFLATDDDIRAFLRNPKKQDAQQSIQNRLQEYVKKYSVYNEIVIFDTQGLVQTNLDTSNRITQSTDPLLAETLNTSEDYVETFRYSDIYPAQKQSLIYSCAIRSSNEKNAEVIGVLCLFFRFENEMQRIYTDLLSSNSASIVTIIDEKNNVIASNNTENLALGSQLPSQTGSDFISYRAQPYLSTVTPTTGYQGFYGLNWSSQIITPLKEAFNQNQANQLSPDMLSELLASNLFSDELKDINRSTVLVRDDLNLVVLNGIIASARQYAVEFMPVLEAIKKIGEDITNVFTESINDLLSTVITSRLDDVSFRAALAVDIMDRNLYERANDCRWWALTTAFKQTLQKSRIESSELETITNILVYINDLYTVYTNLYIYDTQGTILAVSNPNQQSFINQKIGPQSGAQGALQLNDSQKYTVSHFTPSPLYDNRHTYIYNASITNEQQTQVVGGIGVVFDSEPEFSAMLNDTLPKNSDGHVVSGCFGLYCQTNGLIISATEHSPQKVGQHLTLDKHYFELESGGQYSEIITFCDKRYSVGIAASKGYREYKTTGDYTNDVLAFVFTPI